MRWARLLLFVLRMNSERYPLAYDVVDCLFCFVCIAFGMALLIVDTYGMVQYVRTPFRHFRPQKWRTRDGWWAGLRREGGTLALYYVASWPEARDQTAGRSSMSDESVLMPPPPPRLPPGSAGGLGGGDEKRQQVPPPPPFAGKRRKREQKEEREGQNNQKQRGGTMGVGEDSSSSSSSSRPLGRSAAAEEADAEGRGLRVTASNNGSNIVAAIAGHGGGGVVVDVVAMGARRPNGRPQQGEDYEQYGALVASEQQLLKPTMAAQITAAAATASTALPCYSYHHHQQHQHQQHQHQQQQQPGPSSTRSPRCENADSVGGHTGGVENVPPPPPPPPLPMSLPMSMDGMPTMTMYEGNTHGNACDGVQQQQREQHQFPSMSNPPPPPTGSFGEAAAFIAEQQHQQQGGQDADEEDSATTAQPEIPSTTFADIIGHGQAKLRLDEALLPLALPPDLTDAVLTGVRAAPATILLHGPPGTGKSLLARAVAGESSSPLLTVGPSDVLSKFVGESERSIRQLFDAARMEAARSDSRCCVLFFDEIDSIGGARSGMGGAFGNGGGGGAMTASVGGGGGGGDGGSGRRVLAELLIQLTRNFNEVGEEEEDDDVEEDDGSVCSAAMKVDPAGAGAPAPSASSRAISPVPPRSGVSSNDASADVGATSEQDHQQALQHHHQQLELPQKRRQRKPKVRIIVVAATNRPEDCDPALLRRFAVRVFVGPPTRRDRKKILSKFLSDVEHRITPSHLEEIAAAT